MRHCPVPKIISCFAGTDSYRSEWIGWARLARIVDRFATSVSWK
jgi:hypothetical protein